MGSPRTPGVGEDFATDIQPSGYHNETEVVQNMGAMLWGGAGWVVAANALDTPDNSSGASLGEVAIGLCNQNGNFDQMRNNTMNQVALGNEPRTVTVTSEELTSFNHSKLHLRLLATAVGTGTLQVQFSGTAGVIATFVPITPEINRAYLYQIAPGLPNTPEEGGAVTTEPKVRAQRAGAFVPGKFVLTVIKSDASSWSYGLLYGLTL